MGGFFDSMSGFAAVIGASQGWLVSVILMSLRLGSLFLMTPVLGGAAVPRMVRALLVLGLSGVFVMGLPESTHRVCAQLAHHPGLLMEAAMTELALGITLGLAVLLAFSVFSMAGQFLDVQIGFGMGRALNPAAQQMGSILSLTFQQTALLVFFLVNGHHALMRGVSYSLERFPLGLAWAMDGAFLPMVKQAGGLFSLTLALTAPVVFCLLLVEMALGALARNLPQINMLILGIPLKIVVGLMALAMWFTGIGPVMSRVYASIYRTWDQIFVAVPQGNEPPQVLRGNP